MILESVKDPSGAEEDPIYALAWYDKRTRYIASSCGSTVQVQCPCRTRHEIRAIDNIYETYNETICNIVGCFYYRCISGLQIRQ